MDWIRALQQEFETEMANTRACLERVPDAALDFQPHPKSMTMRKLANHIAELPTWVSGTLCADEFDMDPPGGPKFETPDHGSRQALLESFDHNVAEAKASLAKATEAQLDSPWTLKNAGHELFTMPKGAVLRTWVLSHVIHHRAQLGVYLRLKDVALPQVYGPTADDQGM
jgi:uncharacterized damage-inducible protein DinB